MDIRWYLKKLLYNKLAQSKPLGKSGHVCMIHIGRCGSTVLSNMIEQNFSINWAGELYEPIFKLYGSNRLDFNQVLRSEISPIDYLSQDMKEPTKPTKPIYGFEIKPYHFRLLKQDPQEYVDLLGELGFTKFILLNRANRLRKIISSLIAHQTGVFHVSPGHFVRSPKTKVFINLESLAIDHDSKTLLEYLQDYDKQWAMVNGIVSDRDLLSLEYSRDIEKGLSVGYGKVSRFLDLPLKTPKVYYKRTNPYPLSELVENYEELCNLLGDTKYSWMLEP